MKTVFILKRVCINHYISYRNGLWHGSMKDGTSSGDNCEVWTSTSPHRMGRGTIFRDHTSVMLLQEDSASCDSNMAVLCLHLTQTL